MNKNPVHGAGLPARSQYIAWAEFTALTGIHPSRLGELLETGWIETREIGAAGSYLFRETDVYRVRKLERICADFELPALGGAIVVDLLERIDRLEHKVRELSALLDMR
jgi:chaperone modulatory protein CbpM